MSFIRPDAAAQIMRFRETLVGLAATALGLWWMITGTGAVILVGVVLTVAGPLLAWAGIQRARFRGPGQGPGMVRLLEGQLTYYGPSDGGAVFTQDITALALHPGPAGAEWVIQHHGGPPLSIPVDAAGADALFDVFAALPGLDTQSMLAHLIHPPDQPVVIWAPGRRRLH